MYYVSMKAFLKDKVYRYLNYLYYFYSSWIRIRIPKMIQIQESQINAGPDPRHCVYR
jgi:hypothetical protein